MNLLTKKDANLRAILIISVAMLAYALNDDWFRANLPRGVLSCLGVINVGLIGWRGWLDTSSKQAAQSESGPVEVAVKNSNDDPIPTEEVKPDA